VMIIVRAFSVDVACSKPQLWPILVTPALMR
jgi:hypothetical protein